MQYTPLAGHSAILYYCITDLPAIDPMYHFSLNWYINLYIYSIENANRSKDIIRRLKFLTDAITYNLYCSVCRSLFEKDKLLFSFILTTKILLANNIIDINSFKFLLTGGNQSISIDLPNPDPKWITNKIWDDIKRLEQISSFKNFSKDFSKNLEIWKNYYDAAEPHKAEIPKLWIQKLSKFENLILLRALRPDKITEAIMDFVVNEMGEIYVNPPPFDITKSCEDANCLMPLLFILSPGADPMGSLLSFAEKMGFDESFQSISLGQGKFIYYHITTRLRERVFCDGFLFPQVKVQ